MQTLKTSKFVRLELSEKNLTLSKYADIIINPMTQTRKK